MMYITQYAKFTSIPRYILRYLNREGLVEDPLSQDDLLRLQFLEKVWGNKKLLRSQLSHLSIKARQSFLRTADLQTKWERYAYSRFFNLDPGQKLPMGALIEEVQTTFSFLLSKKQISLLYKIRNRAQVARHRKKNQQEND